MKHKLFDTKEKIDAWIALDKAADYSVLEQRLLAIMLPKLRVEFTTAELIKKFYGNKAPRNDKESMVSVIRHLQAKIIANNEPFRLQPFGTNYNGPITSIWWMEKVKAKKAA